MQARDEGIDRGAQRAAWIWRAVAKLELADVSPRAEGPPRAREHNGANGIVSLSGAHRLCELSQHLRGQGVELVRLVEREGLNAVGHVRDNRWHQRPS